MLRALAVVSVAALSLTGARSAEAKCAGPGIAAVPASGGVTNGVSWVFAPPYRDVRVTARSAHDMDAEVVAVSKTAAFVAYRVEVRFRERPANPRYTVQVAAGGREVLSLRYQIESHQTPRGRVLLADGRYIKDGWTCSHTDSVVARPMVAAPAYRIEWARSEAAYRAGEREVLVVPASMTAFWNGDGSEPPAIELGFLNCFGETIPAAALAETVYLGIVPLGPWATPAMPANPIAVRSGSPPLIEVLGDPVEPEPVEYTCGLAAHYDQIQLERAREPGVPPLLLALLAALAALPLGFALTRRLSTATAARLDAWSLPQLALACGLVALAGPATIAAAGGFLAATGAALCGAVSAMRARQSV